MKLPRSFVRLRTWLGLAVLLSVTDHLAAQPAILWEAFNDHNPTVGVTSPNATSYDMNKSGAEGFLKDIVTGDDVTAYLVVSTEGNQGDNFGANSKVNVGSPAYKLFNGKVDIGNDGIPGLRGTTLKIVLTFSGLD